MRRTSMRSGDVILAALAALALGALRPGSAQAQELSDLLGGKNGSGGQATSPNATVDLGRNRADLALSPNLRPVLGPEKKTVSLSAQADLRMICGQYDLKASLQSLLGREAREEFLEGILGTLVQELIGSGMELLCQAEPTLCTLLQNHSVAANLKLTYYKDLCQAVESAVVDSQKKIYADAVDQCMKEKRDQGVPLDRAVDLCQKKPTPLTDFRGNVVGTLDLGKELHGIFDSMGLSPTAQKLAQRLSDQTTLGPKSVAADLDPSAVPRAYDEAQADYAKRLNDLVSQAADRQPIATVDLQNLVPAGATPISADEIRDYARLSPRERLSVVGSLSSALALVEMGDSIRELERALEVLRGAPTVDENKRKLLEDRLSRLKGEKLRLVERFRDQELLMQAVAQAKTLAAQEFTRRISAIEAQAGQAGRKRDLTNDSRSYGTLPSASAGGSSPGASGGAASASGNCANCGLDFSFGSYELGR
jgi:hypothetical protein